MKLWKLAAATVITAACTLPLVTSPASASSCNSGTVNKGTIYQWEMEVCSGQYGGVVFTYSMKYTATGHFGVWNHDVPSEQYSTGNQTWVNGTVAGKFIPYYQYTCAQFFARQPNGSYAPLGNIGCLRV